MTRDLQESRQCIVVLTDDWRSTNGSMRRFERDNSTANWKEKGHVVPVVVGKKGLGQGIGLIHLDFKESPQKKEGDNRAPAGVFFLSSAFGYADAGNARWAKLPYVALSNQIEAIDDPQSHSYNKLVDRSRIARVDWHSSEKMRRDDSLYKWGVVVNHNPSAIPGAGSCIFLHVWKDSSTATTGCTAMAETEILKLLHWLDPALRPILVQMPRDVYRSVRAKYDLPMDVK